MSDLGMVKSLRQVYDDHIQTIGESYEDFVSNFIYYVERRHGGVVVEFEGLLLEKEKRFGRE